ncbi:hypothetical protein SI859A1_00483 [Aurantimonas manganoxydans SI85-9A1]|uniref:Uncharacterized protein n=1 Tax=Aurantimonas manganoxydans (strain ATCC BAA-1229 / DSM 21871 / SI85-9A1) TaxID=287752 RepID=Q1YGV7_AURMS|nr:hypothetical protein SI859A1_00483 [Aurantimonas manganoxydans SI85-9A1]
MNGKARRLIGGCWMAGIFISIYWRRHAASASINAVVDRAHEAISFGSIPARIYVRSRSSSKIGSRTPSRLSIISRDLRISSISWMPYFRNTVARAVFIEGNLCAQDDGRKPRVSIHSSTGGSRPSGGPVYKIPDLSSDLCLGSTLRGPRRHPNGDRCTGEPDSSAGAFAFELSHVRHRNGQTSSGFIVGKPHHI